MANEYHFDISKWEVNQEGRGKRVHPMVALLLASMVGGLFVVFLPFIGLYLFGKFMAVKAIKNLKPFFTTTFAPIAEPGAAYMTGAKSEGSPAAENTFKELSEEIESRRTK